MPNAEERTSIGTVILRGASKSGPKEWSGKLYNAEDGKIYEGVVILRSASELRLKGCLWGVLCNGETWRSNGPRVVSRTSRRDEGARL